MNHVLYHSYVFGIACIAKVSSEYEWSTISLLIVLITFLEYNIYCMPPSHEQKPCHSTLQIHANTMYHYCVCYPFLQAISACEKCQHWKWALMLMEAVSDDEMGRWEL